MISKEMKQKIDNMSQYELCRAHRFAPIGDPMFQGETGDYFAKKLKESGGFTPEISKELGW